ncbi:MAG TPA: MarR family transcriptional regulator [Actinomycetes bacterium]
MTRWLTDSEQRAWRGYQAVQAQLSARLNRQLQTDSGLSLADYEVLVALTDRPEGQLRVFELAEALQWEQSRLSHHLARMQQRGLVNRRACREDRRGSYVLVTAAGRRANEAAAPGHVDAVQRLFFGGLTPEQVELVELLSGRILARLAAEAEPVTV